MRIDLGKVGEMVGKAAGALGLLVVAVSLVRLDGTGVGVGVMLVLYGLGLALLSGIYGELRRVREVLERPGYRESEVLR